jgi:thymidylate kinase
VAAFNALARVPDLTIYVDVSVDVAEARREKRGGPVEIFDARALQTRVRQAYLDELALYAAQGATVVTIDGTPYPDQVFAEVLRAVEACISEADSIE